MSRSFIKAIAALALATSALAAETVTIARAAIDHAIEVRHVSGALSCLHPVLS